MQFAPQKYLRQSSPILKIYTLDLVLDVVVPECLINCPFSAGLSFLEKMSTIVQ